MFVVYLISFSNGKSYVGVSSRLKLRLKEHETADSAVGRAMRVHDWTAEVLFSGSRDGCFREEVRLIAELGTLAPGGYNLTTGGEGGFDMPPELVARRGAAISEALWRLASARIFWLDVE